jgi:Rrf2 family protein
MRVSQRLDYTVRGLTALAQRPYGTFVAAGEIADELALPRRFVEQQFTELARAGIVDCRRGAGGGCTLARPAEEISLLEIVRAVQGAVLDVPHVTGSSVSEMWAATAASLELVLGEANLRDLAQRQTALDAETSPMYYI